MFYSLDRFEGEIAVLVDDNRGKIDVKKNKLPPYAEPGMVFTKTERGFFVYDPVETKKRKERIARLQDELFL